MNYTTVKDKRDDKPRIIASWNSLGEYLEDVQKAYASLPVLLRHDKPAIKAILLPDSKITDKLESFRMRLDSTEFVKSTRLVQTIGEGTLDVGLYLEGVPECFVKTEKLHGNDVRIVFSPEVHCTSNKDALYLRGAAVLSIIDSLESQGNRVELWMGWDNTVGAKDYESRILVKRANDYATAQQLAGVACDSRFLNSCEFNMISHFLNTSSVGHNAGHTMPGDIVLDGSYEAMKHFDSVESTLAWIKQVKSALASGENLRNLQA